MSDVGRSIKEGTGLGLIAGAVSGAAVVVTTLIGGDPPIAALRTIASLLLGPAALERTPAPTAAVIGIVAHLYLSALFGLFYGVYNSALTMPTRRSLPREAIIGMLYGALLWLVNFHVFAPLRAPWFLVLPPVPMLVLHVVSYGLPLGLLYATAERHVVLTSASGGVTALRR